MRLSELFYSIQGEGTLAGVPSVFIRTTGCNLRCGWCDTPYTSWTPEGNEYSIDQIMEFVGKHSKGHTVVTGGEPMIAPGLVELTELLTDQTEHVTIETAGTVYRPGVLCDLMSISPKLANSTPNDATWGKQHDRLRIQPEVLRQLTRDYPYQLKFVVAGAGDLPEIHRIVEMVCADPSQVLLMPEGTDRNVLRERGVWLAELAKQEGFRYSPRLHVELYGNKRGT